MNNNYLYEYFSKNSLREEVYIVKEGDTLYNIAKSLNIDLNDLIKENNLQNFWIFPNQVLVIPRDKNNVGMYFEEYQIKFNDTLKQISENFNISLEELMKYNDLGNLKLVGNQEIKIPRQYNTYTIIGTDTLDSVLRKTNMSCYELLDLNYNKLLIPGTVLRIK